MSPCDSTISVESRVGQHTLSVLTYCANGFHLPISPNPALNLGWNHQRAGTADFFGFRRVCLFDFVTGCRGDPAVQLHGIVREAVFAYNPSARATVMRPPLIAGPLRPEFKLTVIHRALSWSGFLFTVWHPYRVCSRHLRPGRIHA
eukprot:COSAG02_NODE_1810_length_10825_cov_43.150848_4_plen_146_part_00